MAISVLDEKFTISIQELEMLKKIAKKFKGTGDVPVYDKCLGVKREELLDTLKQLAGEGYIHLSNITAVDKREESGGFVLYYTLYSYDKEHGIIIKTNAEVEEGDDYEVPSLKPIYRLAIVPSLTPIYKSADWHEREVYDMFGITFEGHPNMKRILLPASFEGHPLRKEYSLEDEQLCDMETDFELTESELTVEDLKKELGGVQETRVLHINMGPQHPSTHGVLRLRTLVDGERIVKMYPVLGYLHRGIEKIAENLNYNQLIPYFDRLDYVASMLNEFPYVLCVEDLMGTEVPERAQYLRIIMAELSRIASHLLSVATWPMDLGATTPFMYCFREREQILEIFEDICRSRMHFNYMQIGGVRRDLNDKTSDKIYSFVDSMPERLEEYHRLITGNEILMARAKGVGVLDRSDAINYGVTGPMLRASGVEYDLRKAHSYSDYYRFKFKIPVYSEGDCYARYLVRIDEITESLKIINQAMDNLPEGDFSTKVPRIITPPIGMTYNMVEHAKGEMGVFLVSNGTPKPERLHIRSPSFSNLGVLQHLCEGENIADVISILGTIDPVMGCVDR